MYNVKNKGILQTFAQRVAVAAGLV